MIQHITETLNKLIEQNPEAQTEKGLTQIINMIEYYKTKFEEARDETDENSMVMAIFDLVDYTQQNQPTEVKEQAKCKKGCAFCCHISVNTTAPEVNLIVDYCKENNIEIDEERVAIQATLDRNSRPAHEKSACTFLDTDNTCKIYPVRPLACRKYLVASDPDKCDAKKYPPTTTPYQVGVLVSLELETIASAIGNMKDVELGDFCKLLLKKLKSW